MALMFENAGVPNNARAKYIKYVRRARTIDHAGTSTAHSLQGVSFFFRVA
jgi:hypothetical protein